MAVTRDDVARLRENDPRTPMPEADMPAYLAGRPMDPLAIPPDPLPPLAGLPFMHTGAAAVIVGPTGGGRSALIQAGFYDAARASLRAVYLGSEISEAEFNARAAALAAARGDDLDSALQRELAGVRYLDLAETILAAWSDPDTWVAGVTTAYELVGIDPVSAVASALMLDFDKSNDDWVRFFDKLIQPLTARGVAVLLVDNVGHAEEAKRRAKGASAKSDRADLTFSCSPSTQPAGLLVKAQKVRSVRAGFRRGDEWLFEKDTQRITPRGEVESRAPTFRPTRLMQRASEVIEDNDGLSRNAIRTAVGGRSENIGLALELLIQEGYVDTARQGQTNRHTSIKPFRDATSSTVSQPVPNRFPDTVHEPGPPVPGPLRPELVPVPVQLHTTDSLVAAVSAGEISDTDAEAEWQRIEREAGAA
jgi:hypothetical protein